MLPNGWQGLDTLTDEETKGKGITRLLCDIDRSKNWIHWTHNNGRSAHSHDLTFEEHFLPKIFFTDFFF